VCRERRTPGDNSATWSRGRAARVLARHRLLREANVRLSHVRLFGEGGRVTGRRGEGGGRQMSGGGGYLAAPDRLLDGALLLDKYLFIALPALG
jgi:hypothetical protein